MRIILIKNALYTESLFPLHLILSAHYLGANESWLLADLEELIPHCELIMMNYPQRKLEDSYYSQDRDWIWILIFWFSPQKFVPLFVLEI